MILEFLWSAIYLVLALAGLVGVLDARSYGTDQREAAPRLWRSYLTGATTAVFVGLAGLAWTLTGDPPLWIHVPVLGTFAILLPLVQSRMRREMGTDRSPLWALFE